VHVPEEAAVAIGVVEPRVGLELDTTSARRETLELALRLARVALPLSQLGRVDLHEANPIASANVERVTVADAVDRCALTWWLGARLCAPYENGAERESDEEMLSKAQPD
jgi:hypothetical protein